MEYRKEGTRIYKAMEELFKGRVFELLEKLSKNAVPNGLAANPPPVIKITVPSNINGAEVGRNDRVKISNGTETRELKYKKAEPLLASGEWKLVQ